MRISSAPAVAASSEETGPDGVRRPGGEVHAWLPGQNQTLCGLPLSRTRLRRFPHVRFDYSSTDVLTEADTVGHVCPRCLAATGGSRDRRQRQSWVRTSPRP
ncbi:hypothetical protein ABUL04_28425 [Micromonospora harpali]|uniref:Uncharacterized protein n=2 Tax=Micromonospora TaxID=1873 RepID=A0A1C4W298_9ACTN|nr:MULTISPECIES: hypothetical protein [Micromonospora]MDI5937066.1 hypothetical protein [Micromonospora sp. DH15]OON32928.1 hypothetical protein BSA16_03205 [Micromonospora sp. Rc5]SCE90161.1 hypothetical protein GA0070558_112189 [Micromonospora haikouensis]